jgi:hypothetical protein
MSIDRYYPKICFIPKEEAEQEKNTAKDSITRLIAESLIEKYDLLKIDLCEHMQSRMTVAITRNKLCIIAFGPNIVIANYNTYIHRYNTNPQTVADLKHNGNILHVTFAYPLRLIQYDHPNIIRELEVFIDQDKRCVGEPAWQPRMITMNTPKIGNEP